MGILTLQRLVKIKLIKFKELILCNRFNKLIKAIWALLLLRLRKRYFQKVKTNHWYKEE